jgi:DNA repair exonuclease SbcCD nuclease subunit
MDVLFIGDPHIQLKHLATARVMIDRLETLANCQSPAIIVIAGDLLHNHERIHTTEMNVAIDLVRRMRTIAPTFVLVGNHDYIQNCQFLTTNHWMNALKDWDGVTIVDEVITRTYDRHGRTFVFVFVPYVPCGRFVEALDTCGTTWTSATCIFAHQEFRGCNMGAIVSETGDVWDTGYPHVVSGHIHGTQTVGRNVYYPGTPMQHTFGEGDNKRVSMLSFEASNEASNEAPYTTFAHDLGLPRKRTVHLTTTQAESYDVHADVADNGDTFRYVITGTTTQIDGYRDSGAYANMIASASKIVLKRGGADDKGSTVNGPFDVEGAADGQFDVILRDAVVRAGDVRAYKAYEWYVNDQVIDMNDVRII